MEKLLGTGKVKAIGVANYSVRYLEELLPAISIVPAVNQLENHPFLPQQEAVDYCRDRSIHVTAYSPLGSSGSPLLSCRVVHKLATRKGVSTATILLSWHGASPHPLSPLPSSIGVLWQKFDPPAFEDLNV
jgi:glycerol 2-dehydrogenase (NADP+)